MLRLVSGNVELSSSSDHGGASWLHDHGGLELGDKLVWLLSQDWVWHQQVVVDALTKANLGGGLVGHGSDGEWEGWEALVHFDHEGTGALHLQVVHLVKLSLVDSASLLATLWLALAGGDIDVEANDVTWSKLKLLNIGSWGGLVDDDIVSIDQVLLDLVGEDSLNSIALELLSDLLDHTGHIGVGGGLLDLSLGSLEGVPSSQHGISLASFDLALTNNGGGGGVGSISIDVGTTHAKQKNKGTLNKN